MNVVLVIIDSLRRDHVGAYGNGWIKTPNLDALAGESLVFTHAYPEAIPSIPARRGIHTGLRSFPFRGWELGNVTEDDVALWGWEPIPEEQTTLSEILLEEGYQTLFVTDTLHQFRASYSFHRGFRVFDWVRGQERDLFVPRSPSTDRRIEETLIGGPNAAHAEEIMLQYFANTQDRRSEEDWFAPRVFGKGAQLLEAAANLPEGQPFFLVVDAYDPHEPWDPPRRYVDMYSDGYEGPEPYLPSSGPSDWMTEAQLDRMHALYSGEVTMMDAWLGRFLDKMDETGLAEDTLLVLLSDHGHAFGEHGYAGKVASALYPELTDIAFMMRHSEGRRAGERSDYHASTHDVAPTILGSLGIETPAQMTGQDLSAFFGGGTPGQKREHFTLGYNDHAWARDERYIMFARNDGSEAHLFDIEEDPEMRRNIAGERQDVLDGMWNDYVLADAGGPLPRY
jgi:arylsulfatase A-like enzyme